MREPQRLKTLWLSTACYRDSFTLWPKSASELYGPNDRRLLAKLVPLFANRRCHVVSVTDPYGRILDFLDRSMFYICLNDYFIK
jgi:hypothetical protein